MKRLTTGGRLIDRTQSFDVIFNGRRISAHPGDTVASALMAGGERMVGRSFKYHRPRGIVASGAEEPNALMNMGAGDWLEPNQRSTVTPVVKGQSFESQNHWPSLEFDVGVINAKLSRFFPAGFYYKTFMRPRWAWKHLFEPFIRQSAGLGKAPDQPDPDSYEHFYAYTDVLIVGGGIAGLQAALEAGRAGAKVLLLEQNPYLGGRALVDVVDIDGKPSPEWIAATLAALDAMPNVTIRTATMAAGVFDHGYVTAQEQVAGYTQGSDAPRHRFWRIRAKRIITATGAIERPLTFAGNDIPGVMLATAVRDYAELYATVPGERTVIVTNNDDAYRTALTLHAAGIAVPAVLDARPEATGTLPDQARAAGIRVETNAAIAKVHGKRKVTSVDICDHTGECAVRETIPCDSVAMSGGWSPVVHLWSHCGGKLNWDEGNAMFSPDLKRPPTGDDGQGFVIPAGSATGDLHATQALANAVEAGRQAAREAGFTPSDQAAPLATAPTEAPMLSVWMMPMNAPYKLRAKAFLDFQNDVKASDVALAAREGFTSVEHTKRYTTLGMATDQGKLSNINGLAILAESLNTPIPQVGTTTFRPPYTPISLAAIAGDARGPLFKPTRKSAMDGWHDANGADWEPVADWRRPYTYQREGEAKRDAVHREILNTRNHVGMLDASTLGKILVKGPDAGKFLDLIYTNMMSNLAVGKCRYGLMCSENGFLFDDGVVARLSEDSFICHTTSGGSDRVHAWIEEWLQTEWWDLQVYTANLTEQYAQIAIVGPDARNVLEAMGGMNVSREAMPFMTFTDGELAGIPARAYRISFSGELSYEIAVPASRGQEFWDAALAAGAAHSIMPYGTEALHVMRAEKGFIMIGDETDGTVTPLDLNLGWAVSKKKEDFIGKRALEREFFHRADRKQLVGLLPDNPDDVLPDGAHAVEPGTNIYGQKNMIGHVTSTYYSPTLKHGIAMALIKGGANRMGETLSFPLAGGNVMTAKVVDPVFYDKEGARQNV